VENGYNENHLIEHRF